MDIYIPLSMIRVMEQFRWDIMHDDLERSIKNHHFDLLDDDGTPVIIDINKVGNEYIGSLQYRNQIVTLTDQEKILIQPKKRDKKLSRITKKETDHVKL